MVNPLTEAQQTLASDPENIAITKAVTSQWLRGNGHIAQHIKSAGMWGLVQAAHGYDASVGPFKPFLMTCVYSACRDAVRQSRPLGFQSHRHGTPPVVGHPDDFSGLPGKPIGIATDEPVGQQFEERDYCESLLAQLTPHLARILRAIYLEGQPHEDAARSLGCSINQVRSAARLARRQLQRRGTMVTDGPDRQARRAALPHADAQAIASAP